MKPEIFITGLASISAQETNTPFEGEVTSYSQNIFPAVTPQFKEHIPAMALRRMSKAVKMGLTAARLTLTEAGISKPDAIITGTGQGCKQDTEKFLGASLAQEGGLLAPTAFIQSTHNTVGGQIALNLKCHSYNVTYTHNSASLEAAFLDAQLQFMEQPEIKAVLVGGVEEISEQFTSFLYLDKQLKQKEICNLDLLKSSSPGTITSEGAQFFAFSRVKIQGTYALFLDVAVFRASTSEVVEEKVKDFLDTNELSKDEIDLVILGNNGDNRFDHFYTNLTDGMLRSIPQVAYKHLVGDYNTVTGYAVWLGCQILKRGEVPEILRTNEVQVNEVKKILLYNQYLGENHSIILLGSP